MRVAVKPVITTGVALVGASVIAVAPIEPPAQTAARVVEQDVSLTASSLAYVPINMIEHALSAPANMVAALDRLASAMVISGSWNDSHPNNVWGWDPANPAMFREMINTLIPFPAFSQPWGTHLDWWVTANFPMYAGCAYECEDLPGMLDRMFKVPMSEFYSEDGYTFPTVINPIDGQETEWSEQTVKLDPAEPIQSVWDSLVAEPTGIKTVTWYEIVTAVANFGAALQVTGHLPDWVAVREIEQFFKYFLPAPEEEVEESGADDQTVLLAASNAVVADGPEMVDVSTLAASSAPDSDTAEVAADQTSAGETLESEAVDSPVESPLSVVDKATDALKQKFASVQDADEDETDEVSDVDSEDADEAAEDQADSDDTAAADSEDAATDNDDDTATDDDNDDRSEAAPSTSTGGKHRKADDSSDTGSSKDRKSDSKSSSDSSGGDSKSSGGDSKD
ncbi:Uncharacterised protein [Mycolicibacterium vanbaalenii]|uniref:PE-PPE, C-terminal domain protein n=1 Tax=Mycolicibacterium vanbaalenii TaxID=110539 RepID=A0A5S9PQW6_MYCVN|nr:hypothetical protein [Mycolicibacterium vanbaalenii]CAA0107017.1 Uncharacterised protein [Mycolicibacterium vanbaalenii]